MERTLVLTEKQRKRFNSYLRRSDTGCLLWVGSKNRRGGYGYFFLNGKMELAHKVAYLNSGGKLTEDKPLVLHNCPGGDDPACCEPSHLRAGSHADNMEDMSTAAWLRVAEALDPE